MPVPSYNVIADSEIDPESPITSSLMFRLRDNWLAVFGIDNTDPAPAPALPPSFQTMIEEINWEASGVRGSAGTTTFTTPEHIVSNLTHAIEDVQVTAPRWNFDNFEGSGGWLAPSGHFMSYVVEENAGPDLPSHGMVGGQGNSLKGIHVVYSASAPTGVRVATTLGSKTITLANTWQTVGSVEFTGRSYEYTYTLQAKARATASQVFLQFRATISGMTNCEHRGLISMPGCLKRYVPKAAS